MSVKQLALTLACLALVLPRLIPAGDAQTQSSIELKVEALLAKMTLEEKLGQLTQNNGRHETHDALVEKGLVGSLLHLSGAERANRIQKVAVEKSRLGIPLIFGLDVIHGFRTVFPIPLAEAATWDPELAEKSARIAAREARAAGVHWTFAPMVDIARDARWGRIAEGAGEDPYMGSIMAAARVRGFQGKGWDDPESLVACAKHYLAYGAGIAGVDYNPADLSDWTLREIYMPPFKAAVDAGVGTIMSSFNEINGLPVTANRHLLDTVLRKEWGFRGFVVSDWNAVAEMLQHGNVASEAEAAKLALEAGVDMEMVSGLYMKHIPALLKEGRISPQTIDQAVRRILRVKYMLGLFDNPYADPAREKKVLLAKEHLEFARELSAKSIVLLRNQNRLLPLKKDLRSIAVIGPLADDPMAPLGWWHCEGRKEDVITVLKGIRDKLSPKTDIRYAKGCEINDSGTDLFAEATAAAGSSDVAVVVVGENYDMSGEGASRASVELPGNQLDLVKAVVATGTPVVVVLMNGRPLAIPWIAEHVPAVLEAWQLGVMCGPALADVLFGDVNPGGKLPVSFPRATGQEPLFYNHKNTGRPPTESRFTARYFDIAVGPQFPFGYGLSYTSFAFESLRKSAEKIRPDGHITIGATVRNTGAVTGDEVAQLYIRDLVASRTRPVKELKGFRRVTLKPGESARVEFTLGPEDLGFYDDNLRYTVEPGTFKVWIGPNSTEGLESTFEIVQ